MGVKEELKNGVKITRVTGSVFYALEEDPAEAARLALRAEIMTQLRRWIEKEGLTQTEAAERLGVHQPRVSDLVKGRFNRFSLDALVAMAARAGLEIEVILKTA